MLLCFMSIQYITNFAKHMSGFLIVWFGKCVNSFGGSAMEFNSSGNIRSMAGYSFETR